jgi:hypothetical protein
MSADDHDPDKLILRPITDLLKIERRKQLVPNLVHTKGVTTIVAPSGEGKTTTMFSMGLCVGVGLWGGELIEKRPLIWIAGEDQEGLRAIYEAWVANNPDRHPDARFIEEAVDFSDDGEVEKLNKLLEAGGVVRPLIMADALADILGDLNEDKSHDINQVYRNIWRVVNRFDAAFVVLHHSGWDEKRERGSTAIRAKSNILVQIVNFDPESGVVELKHRKLRGGKRLDQFFLSMKLVPVAGYQEAVPLVTGPLSELDKVLNESMEMDKQHGRTLVAVMVQHFPQGATNSQLEEQSGMKNSTFKRGLNYAKAQEWFVGGGGRNKRYNLNPNGCWKSSGSTSGPSPAPYRGLDPLDPKEVGSMDPNWTQVGPLAPNTSCKNGDATASAENPNEINKSESSPRTSETEPNLVADALKQINAKKKPA